MKKLIRGFPGVLVPFESGFGLDLEAIAEAAREEDDGELDIPAWEAAPGIIKSLFPSSMNVKAESQKPYPSAQTRRVYHIGVPKKGTQGGLIVLSISL